MSKWIITALTVALLFVSYFAWNCWQDERRAIAEKERINSEFAEYKTNNKAVKQLELNLIEAINNANKNTDDLRNNVDNGLIELLVKVESIERDSATTSNTADQALRLAKSARQDYYNLRSGINYNKTMIDGWQRYYCLEIAPKNNTKFMCD
ncbi:lysis system i-spanin subunit Rz [Orbus mooreae]|uniref:lysis system i-spanin subunit Rz n=1 Tax=Orbus mooreae TaxID=3074107 RepID=UPI00370D6FCB